MSSNIFSKFELHVKIRIVIIFRCWDSAVSTMYKETVPVQYTFISTAEVISFLNATSVFMDIDPTTWNMNPAKLEIAVKAILSDDPGNYPIPCRFTGEVKTNNKNIIPKDVIAVDLFGLPADYDPLNALDVL